MVSRMLSANTQRNLRNAERYFSEHLSTGEYYAEGEQVTGQWLGKGASALGLAGTVTREDFVALCNNLDPSTGNRLTQRTKSTRESPRLENVSNRRVFYDFTFSPPKSVSILALVAGDARIMAAHREAVGVAALELEAFAGTRVRKGRANSDRATGNIVAATFEHDSSRMLDPHLHTHVVVFNVTEDPVEGRWKALQNARMLQARKYAENVYYHELAKGLRASGYAIANNARGDFEIEGVPGELCTRFSKRHVQIGEALEALLKAKPELGRKDPLELREQLATRDRPRKLRDISKAELERLWRSQIRRDEWESLQELTRQPAPVEQSSPRSAMIAAIEWAEEHLFDRHSVVDEHRIWSEALARARGASVSVIEIKAATLERGYLRSDQHPGEVTLPQVLDRERKIVDLARSGRFARGILVPEPPPPDPGLDQEQQAALRGLVGSEHMVTLFRGAAGTGKSFVLKELVRAIQTDGQATIILCPQRQQVLDLERSGLPNPRTVASFLQESEIPHRPVVIVDEAGQIGGEQMLSLLSKVQEADGRVIFSGDTRQHGPVQASDALLAIERLSGLEPIELRTIRRQDPSLAESPEERRNIELYRQAVAEAAAGRIEASFGKIEEMGAIVECEIAKKPELLAQEYLRLDEAGQSLVVVAQTWEEVRTVNAGVRDLLKERGRLGETDTPVEILEPLDLTGAQKRDPRFHGTDSVMVFSSPFRGMPAGTMARFLASDEKGILAETDRGIVNVPKAHLGKVSVHRRSTIPLARGDRLQLKANRRLEKGRVASNGELVTVEEVQAGGAIKLADGRVLGPGYRQFIPGYAVTSYGSQGKTVQFALLSDSGNRAATNAQQWYVSISRGRKGIRIFTGDKAQLAENILPSGSRPLAIERTLRPVCQVRESRAWRGLLPYLKRFGTRVVRRLRRIGFGHPSVHRPSHENDHKRVLGV